MSFKICSVVFDTDGYENQAFQLKGIQQSLISVFSSRIGCGGHAARQVTHRDYEDFDYLICMESYNIRNLLRIIGSDPDGKVSRLLDHTDRPGDVADPWYTGDFGATWRDVSEGCDALLQELRRQHHL
mgnify:CR=1 FL=1